MSIVETPEIIKAPTGRRHQSQVHRRPNQSRARRLQPAQGPIPADQQPLFERWLKKHYPPASEPKRSALHIAALAYAAKGWPVFPCISNAQGLPLEPNKRKAPACDGFKDATTDIDQINAWWSENPDSTSHGSPNATRNASSISTRARSLSRSPILMR